MRSMTGFGEGEAKGSPGRCAVQITSVNSRYLKLNIKLSREIAFLEPRVRDFLKEKIGRGQYNVWVNFLPSRGGYERAVVDRKACRNLAMQFKKVQKGLGIKGDIDLMTLVNTGAIIKRETVPLSRGPVWSLLRLALVSACKELVGSQEREGLMIKQDLLKRWRKLDALAGKINSLRLQATRRYEKKLQKRVRTILDGVNYDESRLLAEVSIYADRVDISEEMVRIQSHLKHLRKLLLAKRETGKKLDFTIQEILREVNTSANKANDDRISRIAIDAKAEMEKIREQLQNVQ